MDLCLKGALLNGSLQFHSIGTTAELCKFRDLLSTSDREDLELIISAANQGAEVCYEQQVLRDLTAGTAEQKITAVDIHRLLETACGRQVRLINEEIDARVLLLDGSLTNHAVSNGISNAAKYGR